MQLTHPPFNTRRRVPVVVLENNLTDVFYDADASQCVWGDEVSGDRDCHGPQYGKEEQQRFPLGFRKHTGK